MTIRGGCHALEEHVRNGAVRYIESHRCSRLQGGGGVTIVTAGVGYRRVLPVRGIG
uniref:Uncharacterized protein n=1 Tax=Verrucosispora sp. MS100047 TaxID=1410949 RepID=A0A097CSA2_9ACTN|nr:hypothetical protein VASRM7_293 [Verrucosispora sp. MS100047]